MPAPACPVQWFDVVPEADRPLSPAAARIVAGLREGGTQVSTHAVAGPAFWATQEIEESPALVAATVHCVSEACHAA